MAAAANSDGPEKSIAEVQHIVESPVASASVEDDTLFGHDLHLSSNPDPTDDDDERSKAKVRLDAAEKVILCLDPSIPGSLVKGSAGKFLSAVDEIIFLSGGGVDGEARSHATSLLKTAMSLLRTEFLHIISVHSANLDADHRSFQTFSQSMPSEYSDLTTEDSSTGMEVELHSAEERGWSCPSDQSSNLIPSEVISELKEITDRMTAAGYQQELCQTYSSARNEFLSVLGADQLSIEHAQMIEWKTLREMVIKWTRRLNLFVRVLLPRERELCEQIFVASDELKQESFRKIAERFILQLLNVGDVIATRLQSQNEVFFLLDIYEAFSDLRGSFFENLKKFICSEVDKIIEKLKRMVRDTLSNFEEEIKNKKLWKPPQGGQIDPVIGHAMNYITTLVCYSDSLNLLLHGFDGGDDPVGQCMRLFMRLIENRIQKISEFYKDDDALKYIFLMNNIQCMILKVEDSELKTLLEDDWICTHQRRIEQYTECYLRASWSKLSSYLNYDGLFSGRGGPSMVVLKRRFKNFNLAFEKIWNSQKAWIVPDPRLREHLRSLAYKTVIPGYGTLLSSFSWNFPEVQLAKFIQYTLEAYKTVIPGYGTLWKFRGVQQSKFIKYTPEDLENLLSDLFEGTSE